jgi:hypothetical protein
MTDPAAPMVTIHLDGGPMAGKTLQRPRPDGASMPLEISVPDPSGTQAHVYRLVHRLRDHTDTVGYFYEFAD